MYTVNHLNDGIKSDYSVVSLINTDSLMHKPVFFIIPPQAPSKTGTTLFEKQVQYATAFMDDSDPRQKRLKELFSDKSQDESANRLAKNYALFELMLLNELNQGQALPPDHKGTESPTYSVIAQTPFSVFNQLFFTNENTKQQESSHSEKLFPCNKGLLSIGSPGSFVKVDIGFFNGVFHAPFCQVVLPKEHSKLTETVLRTLHRLNDLEVQRLDKDTKSLVDDLIKRSSSQQDDNRPT